ncbi:dTDP-4-dehydrorhamnose reductase [Gammaproteobacteria bacterium]|jgi:dTDP-4-dehydrorhamnose reductase|nr:dTDP-4-dehydrorhamnose reductase [Gammaproteobacteria bacterium]
MKVLVLGSQGQLGRCLSDQFKYSGFEVVFTSRAEIDLGNFEDAKKKISILNPGIVINASGYTAVDEAEDNLKAADLINHLALENISEICLTLSCWLIHVSTDYVFDGKSSRPYLEDDQTNPIGVYGDTKLKGEEAIIRSGCKYLILRTAWVFSEYGNNFAKTMLHLASVHDELRVVGDQLGCPTYAQDIAETIVIMISKINLAIFSSGIFHYCGNPPCSWHSFAKAIFIEANNIGFKTPKLLHSIEASAYPTKADRPAYSVLDCSKIKCVFDINPPEWHKGIRKMLIKLKG